MKVVIFILKDSTYVLANMRVLRFNTLMALVLFVVALLFGTQSVSANSSHTSLPRGNVQTPMLLISRGGGTFVPGGYNPFGYKITALGEEFLKFDGSVDSDVGRLISTLKSGRKRYSTIKEQWLEVMRISKSGQNMRIYRMLQELLDFCVKAGLVD